MLETNLRTIRSGPNLSICTRRATVCGAPVTADLLSRVCGRLRYQHGLAAMIDPADPAFLLIATDRPMPAIRLAGDDYVLDVADAGEPCRQVTAADPQGHIVLPTLVERMLLAAVARKTDLWTLDSPRVWYSAGPFDRHQGIAAYRRYEIAALWLDDIGVGIAVDLGTAFFTEQALAYFFDPQTPAQERHHRQQQFERLTGRQAGQKGTLLYDNGRMHKCYFERAPIDITCSATEKLRIKGLSYNSLYAYYCSVFPKLGIGEDAAVAYVSFPNMGRPQPVAAELVRVRVMNHDVPGRLGDVDKIPPDERKRLVQGFWTLLGEAPFSPDTLSLVPGFWRPPCERISRLLPPALIFGKGQRLPPPRDHSVASYRFNFRRRSDYLLDAGCFSVPPAMPRTLQIAYPHEIDQDACRQLAADLTGAITSRTGRTIEANLIGYGAIGDAVRQLRAAEQAGMVVFILDDDPTSYHEVAFQLSDWRVKRITAHVLREHVAYLSGGAWDKRLRGLNLAAGQRRWDSFINLCALDVLQLLDAVPFRVERTGPYEAQVAIDVGHDRRHFALSLLIARGEQRTPAFRIVTHVQAKPDHKHEQVNEVMLRDAFVALVEDALGRRGTPLASLLVLRDGQYYGQEVDAIDQATQRLIAGGKLDANVRIDFAELRKDTLKALRVWEVNEHDVASNPTEGSVVRLNGTMALLMSTGAATLHQGTAEPLLVTGNGRCSSVIDATEANFDAAQLNWSSPGAAQRLGLPFKRTDEELTARAAQEIKRLR